LIFAAWSRSGYRTEGPRSERNRKNADKCSAKCQGCDRDRLHFVGSRDVHFPFAFSASALVVNRRLSLSEDRHEIFNYEIAGHVCGAAASHQPDR
jgi:hypothetical protein